MSGFERNLSLWVVVCIAVGIALGHSLPGFFQAVGAAEGGPPELNRILARLQPLASGSQERV
jgi:ACR3 family arsenite efflux pump ArsB